MPRLFCIRHFEQFTKDSGFTSDYIAWLTKKGILKQTEESDCEYCQAAAPFFAYPISEGKQEPSL